MSVMHYSYLDAQGKGVTRVHHSKLNVDLKAHIEKEIYDIFDENLPNGLAFGARHPADSFDEKICYHCCQERIRQGKCVPHATGFVYYEGQVDQYGHRFDVCQSCITNVMLKN